MSQQTDPNALLMGGGGKSAKFETPGDKVEGTIVDFTAGQQTEFGTNKPLFWDDGSPKMQVVVRLQTNEPPADENDDGIRVVYLKGGTKRPSTQGAVAEAVRTAGAAGLANGGWLGLAYTGDAPSTGKGNPPKNYVAQYKAPQMDVATATFAQPQAAAPPAPAAAPVMVHPTPTAPAAAAPSAASIFGPPA